jgi:hypothetical protein
MGIRLTCQVKAICSPRSSDEKVDVATENTAANTSAFEETANRIRKLDENLIQLAIKSGQNFLDTYEKALQSLVDFEKSVASRSQLDWVTGLAFG